MYESRPKSVFTLSLVYLALLMLSELIILAFFQQTNGLSDAAFVGSQKIMLAILTFSCIVLGMKYRFIANPYFCLTFTPLSLLIYDHTVSFIFLQILDPTIYAFGTCSIIALMLGVEIFASKTETSEWLYNQNRREYREPYFRAGLVISALGMFFNMMMIAHLKLPGCAVFAQMVYIGMAFLLKSKKQQAYVVVALIMLFMLMTTFRKTVVLNYLFLVILSIYNVAYITRAQLAKLVGIMALAFLFMIFVAYPMKMYFRLQDESFQGLQVAHLDETMEESTENYGDFGGSLGDIPYLVRPYLSMTTEWTNLNYVIETQPERTNGLFFIRPICKILQMDASWPECELTPYNNTYNTFAFICPQWKDFGYVGAVILCFFEGLLVGWGYKRFRERSNSPIETVRYVWLSTTVVELFFSNHFLLGGIHIIFLVTFMLMVVIKRVNRKLYEEITFTVNPRDFAKKQTLGM